MNLEKKEELKKRILMYVCMAKLAVTPNQVSEEFEIAYPTAQVLLFELALEGHLELVNKGWARYFRPVPIPKEGLEVIWR